MIDLHCHLLPGVDDGAFDLREAVEMARLAAEDGITAIIVTPHQRHFQWPNEERAELERAFERLVASLPPAPRLALGAEIRVDSELLAELEGEGRHELLPLAGSRYLLLELDAFQASPPPEDIVGELLVGGWRPVLAHPERLPWLTDDPGRLAGLVELGALTQVTAMSVTGDFGRRAQACCRFLLDHSLVHFVASDGHDALDRRPLLAEARRALAEGWGEAVADRLTVHHPAAVLADRDLAVTPHLREAAR